MLHPTTRAWLLHLARRALRAGLLARWDDEADLSMAGIERPADPALSEPARVFVTWRDGEDLVGCIGTIAATHPLEEAVERYAHLAAMNDPRTPTPTLEQWTTLRCSISLLSEPVPLDAHGLDAIQRAIRPFEHGVILRCGGKRGLLLPSVWKSLPDPADFIEALAWKAGVDVEREGPECEAQVFTAESFGEGGSTE